MTRKGKVSLGALAAILVIGGAAAGLHRFQSAVTGEQLAVVPARKGEFLVIVRCRGELRARRSIQVAAPKDVPDLRIVWLAPPSSPVKEGDVVVRFDTSRAEQQLQTKGATLKQAQASLDQAVAQARITAEQDKRALAQAGYEVERARLEVSKMEILSKVQGEEAEIELTLAEQKLKVRQATADLHKASATNRIASLTRNRDEAQSEVDITKHRLSQMEIRAPLSGIIVYLPNYAMGWMNRRPYKVGDQVWAGVAVAEIPDLDTLEMEGKVEEIDRGRIAEQMDVRVRVDALPELNLEATLDQLSPLTQMSFEWPPSASFRGYARISEPDPRLRPGMNARMDVIVEKIPDAISVPTKALFTRDGVPIVYVATGGDYRPVEVEVLARNPDEAAVSGIGEGTKVTLAEPELPAEDAS